MYFNCLAIIIISFYFSIGLHNVKTISLNSSLTDIHRYIWVLYVCSIFLQHFAQVNLKMFVWYLTFLILSDPWNKDWIPSFSMFFLILSKWQTKLSFKTEIQTKLNFFVEASSFISSSFLFHLSSILKPFSPPFTKSVMKWREVWLF